MPFELLDLARHKASCTRCRAASLCSVGRLIVSAARTALLTTAEAASWGRPQMGRA